MNLKKRKIIYTFLYPILSVKFFRNVFHKLGTAAKYFEEEKICTQLSKDKKALSGPFKGLKYNSFESAGSVLIPKILGSYEDELHTVLNSISTNNYTEIIDIGCAEGYYALGLALKFKEAKVYAYDLDEKARELCAANALANNLESKITIQSFLNATALSTFSFTGKGLIICDFEGFEKDLFTPISVSNLANCDLIIELHDCNDETISPTILPLFKNTHNLTLIKSNPQKRVTDYNQIPVGTNITVEMLNERNGIIMYWAFLEAK